MKTARVLMLCSLAAIGACHGDAGTPPPPKAKPHVSVPVVAKKGPSAEELTNGMVEAASQGKSQLPVKLKFDLKQRPVLGQPLDIGIAIVPQIDAGPAGIQVTGGEGLTLAADANQADFPEIEAGQVYRRSVKVTPTGEGVILLGVTVSLKHDDITESRVFSIPLIVER
jgi:hypothetical protein